MKYIAHRGYSALALENTKEAFILASKEKGFYGIECDIHLTRDKVFIVHHDFDLKRLANKDLLIKDLSYKEIKKIKLKNKYKIPTLKEYLKILKKGNKIAIIELKININDEEAKQLLKEVAYYIDNIVFISFIFDSLLMIRKYSDVKIQYLFSKCSDEIIQNCKNNKFDLDVQFKDLYNMNVKKLIEEGFEINAWTVDDLQYARELEKMGIHYLTSNILKK